MPRWICHCPTSLTALLGTVPGAESAGADGAGAEARAAAERMRGVPRDRVRELGLRRRLNGADGCPGGLVHHGDES